MSLLFSCIVDIEMYDADSDKQHSKDNEGAGVNTPPAVLREPVNLKSGTEHSKAENTELVSYQSSEADVSNKNVMAYGDGPMLMLTNTSTEFGTDKKDGNIESSSLANELLAASRAVELQSSPKRRKKMKRAKNPYGENPIVFYTENIEGSNLTTPQKAAGGDKSLDGHESGSNSLSQSGGIEVRM